MYSKDVCININSHGKVITIVKEIDKPISSQI